MKSIGSNIWIKERAFKIPIFGNLGTRMTVIKLANGDLMLISPVVLDPELTSQLQLAGPVKYIVGPNSMHHLSLNKYHKQYPEAVLAAPAKLKSKRSDLPIQITIEESQALPWKGEVETVLIDGRGRMSEAVFFHKASRTLIVTDLLFNVQKTEGKLQEMALRLNGACCKLTMTRFGRSIWKDKELLRSKVYQVLDWDFDQIIVAHGEIIPENGKQEFLDSFQWLLA